jgi:hypothetical protein
MYMSIINRKGNYYVGEHIGSYSRDRLLAETGFYIPAEASVNDLYLIDDYNYASVDFLGKTTGRLSFYIVSHSLTIHLW